MIKGINIGIVFPSDKVSTELILIIRAKKCTQFTERSAFHQLTDLKS